MLAARQNRSFRRPRCHPANRVFSKSLWKFITYIFIRCVEETYNASCQPIFLTHLFISVNPDLPVGCLLCRSFDDSMRQCSPTSPTSNGGVISERPLTDISWPRTRASIHTSICFFRGIFAVCCCCVLCSIQVHTEFRTRKFRGRRRPSVTRSFRN